MSNTATPSAPQTAASPSRVDDRAGQPPQNHPPLDQSDIVAAQMCLEAVIKEIEAEALRSHRAQTTMHMPSTTSSGTGVPAHQNSEQRRAPVTRRWVRVFRAAGDRVRGKVLSDHFSSETGKGRDPWLTELLARASREVEEDDQELKRLPR